MRPCEDQAPATTYRHNRRPPLDTTHAAGVHIKETLDNSTRTMNEVGTATCIVRNVTHLHREKRVFRGF
eukprot:1192931-Prorocentrum_minimum.AAC.2